MIVANENIFLEGENPTLSLSILLSVTEDIIYTLLRNINLFNRFYLNPCLTNVYNLFIPLGNTRTLLVFWCLPDTFFRNGLRKVSGLCRS